MFRICLQNHKRLCRFLLYVVVITMLACVYSHNTIIFGKESDDEPINKVIRRGKTTVKLRIFPSESGLAAHNFNHPYYLKKSTLIDILSSIYYLDKDILKVMLKKGKTAKRVFQYDEIEKLVPLIIHAFSIAKPEQDLLISSYSQRFLLEDLNNVFSLFMTGDKLNIVFGKVRHKGNVSKSSVLTTRRLERDPEPTKVKKSHFWKLVVKPGQQFKPGHNNWLIIDFQNELFVNGVENRKKDDAQKYDKKLKPIVDPLEERIKKLEEMLSKGDSKGGSIEDPSDISEKETKIDTADVDSGYNDWDKPSDNNELSSDLQQADKKEDISIIKEKFYALRELLDEDLITYIDYDNKKLELLQELHDFDVKSSLKQLKELMDMGFITIDDFDKTKTELLNMF